MSRGQFAFKIGLCFVALVAAKLAFPYVLYAMVNVSGCRGSGGACGALAVVAGMFGGLILIALFVTFVARLFHRRLASVGLSSWWLLAVVSFIVASSAFIYGAGNFWGANFSVGLLWLSFPYTLFALIGFALFLSLNDDLNKSSDAVDVKRAWMIAIVASAVVAAVSLPRVLIFVVGVPVLGPSVFQAATAVSQIVIYPVALIAGVTGLPIDLLSTLVFLGALAFIHFRSRGGGTTKGATSDNRPNPSQPHTPPRVSTGRGAFGRRGTAAQGGLDR